VALWLPNGAKKFEKMFTQFDRIHKRNVTDRHRLRLHSIVKVKVGTLVTASLT